MSKAAYYYNIIMRTKQPKEEWLQLDREIDEWFETASEEEKAEFINSGAGECLAMLCG